jgi:hypothetical protein
MSFISIVGAGLILAGAIPVKSVSIATNPIQVLEETPTRSDVEGEVEQIQDQVIEIRGLPATGLVDHTLLTSEELHQKVVDEFFEDYTPEDSEDDVRILNAFGLIESGFDLYNFYLDLYSEQISGYYDDETKEMYIVEGSGFGGPERLTYAHEYAHALQDQNYDIKNGLNYDDESCEEDSEGCAAVQALLEGDASFVESIWYGLYSTTEDQQEIIDFYSTFESPVYDNAPEFMKEDFIFPYQTGQDFVQYLYELGEWSAVDQAYIDLPASTEQILHPERYPEDLPIPVAIPGIDELLGDGWRELDRNVMGEWYNYLILAYGMDTDARASINEAELAAEGWGGDAYVVYYNDESGDTVMVLNMLWETSRDGEEYADVFKNYATGRFGDPIIEQTDLTAWNDSRGYHTFHHDDLQTVWILAPDAGTAQAIWELIQSQ